MDLPSRLSWLSSGRFLRALGPLAGLVLVATVLYTATSIDRVPPTYQIKLSSTEPGTGLALTLTTIDVSFSERVKEDIARNAFSISPPVDGSYQWQGTTLIFTPSGKLPLATTFKVQMAPGVQDLAGNAQGKGQDLTFTTVGAPKVTSVVPARGAAAVPVDATIEITFDRLMDTQKVLAGLKIEPNIPYTAAWNGPVLAITPKDQLSFATTYSVEVDEPAVDTDGTPLSAYQTSFTTVGIGLHVSALIPAPNVAGVSIQTPIAVIFDGPIDPTTVSDAISLTPPVSGSTQVATLPDDRPATIQPTESPSAAASSAGSGDNVLVFTPDAPLAAHTTYSVSMSSGVRRTNGEAASAESWSFTTGEPTSSALNQIVFLSNRGGVANVWLMNPDGSNQREVTAELVPVSGFDISGDGSTIAYGAGGQVKRMKMDGTNLQVLTAPGAFEYAPKFTPDGTALIVARRDATGADLGYWRIPLVTGADSKQIAPDGAPGLGSVTLQGDGLTGSPGEPSWAPRVAFSADGNIMLVVRGLDGEVELVDVTGANPPVQLGLTGDSQPIWDQQDGAFYVVATSDGGASWSLWRVSTSGATARIAPAVGDLAISVEGGLASVVKSSDGSTHIAYSVSAGSASSSVLTNDPIWSDGSPSFSPDGSLIVFGRFETASPTTSDGIWIIGPNGTDLTNLATDGAYPRWMP
ncbi:MAG: Ig-like domain-containing protein [Candidatus Limnocylindrales bacterium]